MSHVFPKRQFSTNEAVDPEEINGNFRPALNEVQGKLNEHNFGSEGFSTKSYGSGIQYDAVLSLHHNSKKVDHGFEDTTSGMITGNTPSESPTNAFVIEQSQQWSDVDDMTITVTTDSCVLWIQASFQICTIRATGFLTGSYAGYVDDGEWPHPGIQCGIAVDGSVVPETITGSIERSNDHTGEGLAHFANGIVIDTVIALAAGSHTIALRARVATDPVFTDRVSFLSALYGNANSLAFWIGSRSLIVLEMR